VNDKERRIIPMALSKEETVSIVKKFGKNDKDTGSAEVQIALLPLNSLSQKRKRGKQ
jgi:ribosomal protein S15P/S13E